MITTAPTTQHKANNATHFNGFPNLAHIPEQLHNLFAFLRKQSPEIKVELKQQPNNEYFIQAFYPETVAVSCMKIMDQIPSKHYKIAKFSHKERNRTTMLLRKL